jgi:hypothetical protein
MTKKGLVVVVGDSLLMDSIGTNLRNRLALSVVRLNACNMDLVRCVKALQPELVIFELDTHRPCTILSLLTKQSDSLFLGVDTYDSQVLMLDSNRHQVEDMQEFCQLVQTNLEYKTDMRKGGKETEMLDTHRLSERG